MTYVVFNNKTGEIIAKFDTHTDAVLYLAAREDWLDLEIIEDEDL